MFPFIPYRLLLMEQEDFKMSLLISAATIILLIIFFGFHFGFARLFWKIRIRHLWKPQYLTSRTTTNIKSKSSFGGKISFVIQKFIFQITSRIVQDPIQKSNQSIYQLPCAPGPLALPIIGNLHHLACHPDNPWLAFDKLRARYGPVVRLQLGRFPTILISSVETIREVLLIKGEHFANRPHFNRHALYFSMNRQNALALCDWTDIHKQRRSIAHAAVIPRFGTKTFQRLSSCVAQAIEKLLIEIQQTSSKINDEKIILEKSFITELCCRIFFHFLLDKNLDDDRLRSSDHELLRKITENFDLVFYDINQMHLSDFIPVLQNLGPIRKYFWLLYKSSTWIFKQVEMIVMERFEQILQEKKQKEGKESAVKLSAKNTKEKTEITKTDKKICDERFVDRILLQKQYKSNAKFLDFILEHYLENKRTMSWNEMMYEIGDLVGGNSAVANLLFRLLGHLAVNVEVQQLIYEQIKMISLEKIVDGHDPLLVKGPITIEDQHRMPLVGAAIMETLRLALSPIVPHLSRWDTSIQGYFVPKGTMILFNIYHLNLSDKLYVNPFQFNPTRFITSEGRLLKPDYFFPFSHGRRSCLGYKMVNSIISATVANLLLHYKIVPLSNFNEERIRKFLEPKGSLALPYKPGECYNVGLMPRNY